jgi:hypothetical protein
MDGSLALAGRGQVQSGKSGELGGEERVKIGKAEQAIPTVSIRKLG